jgi:hypothetical protein
VRFSLKYTILVARNSWFGKCGAVSLIFYALQVFLKSKSSSQADTIIVKCAQCELAGIGCEVGLYIETNVECRTIIALECGLQGIGSH